MGPKIEKKTNKDQYVLQFCLLGVVFIVNVLWFTLLEYGIIGIKLFDFLSYFNAYYLVKITLIFVLASLFVSMFMDGDDIGEFVVLQPIVTLLLLAALFPSLNITILGEYDPLPQVWMHSLAVISWILFVFVLALLVRDVYEIKVESSWLVVIVLWTVVSIFFLAGNGQTYTYSTPYLKSNPWITDVLEWRNMFFRISIMIFGLYVIIRSFSRLDFSRPALSDIVDYFIVHFPKTLIYTISQIASGYLLLLPGVIALMLLLISVSLVAEAANVLTQYLHACTVKESFGYLGKMLVLLAINVGIIMSFSIFGKSNYFKDFSLKNFTELNNFPKTTLFWVLVPVGTGLLSLTINNLGLTVFPYDVGTNLNFRAHLMVFTATVLIGTVIYLVIDAIKSDIEKEEASNTQAKKK